MRRLRTLWKTGCLALVLGCLLLGILAWRNHRHAPSKPPAQSRGLLLFVSSATALPDSNWHLATMDEKGGQRQEIQGSDRASLPCWSPDGSAIAYLVDSTAYVRWVESGARVLLPTGDRVVVGVSWLPDGRHVAILWTRWDQESGGFAEQGIAVVGVPGGKVRDVLATRENMTSPAVSPDGRWLAYGDDTHALMLSKFGSRAVRRAKPLMLLDGRHRIWRVRWSPDGKLLVFAKHTGPLGPFRETVFAYEISTGEYWELGRSDENNALGELSWRPDSGAVSFGLTDFEHQWSRLYIAERSSAGWRTDEVELPEGTLSGVAGWSPDGEKFAYSIFNSESGRVYVCEADGTLPHPISPESARDSTPIWQPLVDSRSP